MTQEPAEQPKHNSQKYQRIDSHRFQGYDEARAHAVESFLKLESDKNRLYKAAPTDLTSEDYKVRIKRRTNEGREHFDVVSYVSLDLNSKIGQVVEADTAEVTPSTEKKSRLKAKERRAQERKKS